MAKEDSQTAKGGSVWQESMVNTVEPKRASARRGYCEANRPSTVSTGLESPVR